MDLDAADIRGARCLIAGLVSARDTSASEYAAKLRAELERRGAVVLGAVIQRRGVSRAWKPGGAAQLNAPMNAATVLGTGKVEELTALARETRADAVVFLNALSASQTQRLTELTGCRVLCPAHNQR